MPFIVETGGRINCAGIQFLDVLSGVAGLANAAPVLVDGRPPRFGAAHRRKRAALSGVLRELTMQQGFMLAQIVEEIPARDSAVEGRAGGGRMSGDTGGGRGAPRRHCHRNERRTPTPNYERTSLSNTNNRAG